jgi:putative serine protease PepD
MTENDPGKEDETRRLPQDDDGGSIHRYPEAHHSEPSAASTRESPSAFFAAARGEGLGSDQDPRGGGATARPASGVIAAVLVAALVVGVLGGLAGAAGFSLVRDSSGGGASPSASPSAGSSSHIVNSAGSSSGSGSTDAAEAVAKQVLPSVVKINVKGSQGAGSGSGIIIGSDGKILTNNHVVSLAGQDGQISVNFNDGTAKKATVLGTDPLTDLAVIKAQGVSGLQPADIGAADQIAVGEDVVAIGSPFGLEATVTSGIVSALNRPVSISDDSGQSSQATTYPAIQTDAAINPGNSGGPLVDMDGAVIGINSSIRTASDSLGSEGGSIGLGFAIPIGKVWPVVQQLVKGETPTHARLGVSVTDASSNNGLLTGAGIESVNAGSAAERAGLKRGDVVTKVGSDVITGSDSLVATIRGHRPGDRVTLTVVEPGNKTKTLQVTLDSDEGSASS